jgi:hypothetical protein
VQFNDTIRTCGQAALDELIIPAKVSLIQVTTKLVVGEKLPRCS